MCSFNIANVLFVCTVSTLCGTVLLWSLSRWSLGIILFHPILCLQLLFINLTTWGLKNFWDFMITLFNLTGLASTRNCSWKEQNLRLFLLFLLKSLETQGNQPGRVSRACWPWASKRISLRAPSGVCREGHSRTSRFAMFFSHSL